MPPLHGDSTNPGVPGVGGTNSAVGGRGVQGDSTGTSGIGVLGEAVGGDAVFGNSTDGRGVVGTSKNATGVEGFSVTGVGVFASSTNSEGIHGQTNSTGAAAVTASTLNPSGTGPALSAVSSGHGPAGFFDGNVTVTKVLTVQGDILLPGADCAEHFDIGEAEQIEPGTVVVIDQEGALRRSQEAYDKKVAGVVSGAGGYRPGIVLDKRQSLDNRLPVALVGKVYCKVDAQYSPIEVGDLLTTSTTPGHAMRASDALQAFGAVIGKALRPCRTGCGLIPILIALQ